MYYKDKEDQYIKILERLKKDLNLSDEDIDKLQYVFKNKIFLEDLILNTRYEFLKIHIPRLINFNNKKGETDNMKTLKVDIEETLHKTVLFTVPDEIGGFEQRIQYVQEKIKEMYMNKEIVLTEKDYTTDTRIQIEDIEENIVTNWQKL